MQPRREADDQQGAGLALTPEQAAHVLHIYAHERKSRIGRYIAVAGWLGLIKLAVAVGVTTALGVSHALRGDVLPGLLCAVAPAVIGAAIGIGARAHLWVVRPKAQLLLNVLTAASVMTLLVWSAFSSAKHPHTLALLLGAPMTLVWIGFWAYSDKGVMPAR